MSLSRRSIRGAFGKIVLVALGTPMALLATDGCTTQQVATTLRSLEQSGRASFVCLNAPDHAKSPGRPVTDCSGVRFSTIDDYGVENGETTQPHLYALVTQTTRGEVAVIDMSTKVNPVLDENPRVPGANFLPIGAQPIDIVSTHDGNATFVGVAEIGRQGIFALPSSEIRTCSSCAPKNLSDWPACALPGAPGSMVIVDDAPKDGKIRNTCDGTYETVGEIEKDSKGNALVNVVDSTSGRPKIVTAIPELGAIAIIDAQTIFDPERDATGKPIEDENGVVYKYPPGSWKACPIERWVPLSTDVPLSNPPATGPGGPACVDRQIPEPTAQVEFESHPMGMAKGTDNLYIADSKVPIIHVVQMQSPCEPKEIDPLLPSSQEDPARLVTTNTIVVSGTLASSLGKFVYAIDDYDGTVMVFDVGPNSTSRRPISRKHEDWTPAQPPDRVDLGVPVQDMVLIERDSPQTIPATGIAPEGIRCDPDPTLTLCTSDSASCDPETLYRTGSSYVTGAAPTLMRGSFAYLMLSTGQIAVVDIDDYDAKCRVPKRPTELNGCSSDEAIYDTKSKEATPLASSDEASCNVVVPHTLRDANFMHLGDITGQNQPGIVNFPALYSDLGALQSTFDENAIVMRATLPNLPAPKPGEEAPILRPEQFDIAVGTGLWGLNAETGLINVGGGQLAHALAANLEDPRAQTTSQSFSVIYEGALPAFVGKVASFAADTTPATLTDSASRFCDAGVLGQKAFVEMLMVEDPSLTQAEAEKQALQLADYVQITASTPEDDDAYWDTAACSFDQCKAAFGPTDIPKTTRDMKIIEAYQDHVELVLPEGTVPSAANPSKNVPIASIVKCCFPTLLPFNVRVGHQWAVLGTNSGFIHHVVPTPMEGAKANRSVGACRNSCDPRDSRKNGRVRSVPHGVVLHDGDPRAFINQFFRFNINEAVDGNAFDGNPNSPTDNAPKRGTFFQFTTEGSFKPLLANLASNTTEIQPQSIGFVPATGEVVIVDGSLEGIILLNGSTLALTRQYY